MTAPSSTSCGLKNSLCQDGIVERDVDPLEARFSFVDGDTGLWELGLDYGNITCPVGGMVVFHFPVGMHDIVQVPSKEDWDACDLNNSRYLVPLLVEDTIGNSTSSREHPFEDVTYYYNCSEPGEIAYLTCSVPGHCDANQKVTIQTSETEYAYNRTTGNWTLHVDSLSRVLRLLGYRQSSEGLTVMDRGYQTEELADVTTNLIWCALDHCPEFAHDFDPSASLEDCESIVLTLMGFVSRKRPIPQWNVSEDYYKRAIEKGGSNVCTAQSYLTQLYLTKGRWEDASSALSSLCFSCQNESSLIRQAQIEHERLGIDAGDLDFEKICSQAKVSSSSAPSFRHVGQQNESLLMAFLLFTLILTSAFR